MKINVIVAICENFGIGINGKIPWALKKEMAYFAKTTSHVSCEGKQNAIIMGRKTWESIPEKFRPLKGRMNIVLSCYSNKSYPSDVMSFSSFEEALDSLQKLHEKVETIWVIGGYSVYKKAMESDFCSRIYITSIKKEFDCDTFFPKIPKEFTQIRDASIPSGLQEENGLQYEYQVYEKRGTGTCQLDNVTQVEKINDSLY